MSWRTVVISNRCKLDYSMNYMVVRGEDTKRVLLDEIALLIIENNSVSLTGCLITELMNKKIKVMFCDGKRNPQSELVPYYGAHNDSLRIRQQIEWGKEAKVNIWSRIVSEKIMNQSIVLDRNGKKEEAEVLKSYISNILPGDISNREGHAAKVYFNAIFGNEFLRSDEENMINRALNYGYALILSAFNREVTANGYMTQLGLAHDNQFNHFNLSCDLMEPFRVIIDMEVMKSDYSEFTTEQKRDLINALHLPYKIKNSEQTLLNAIRIYTKSVFDALNENTPELIEFVKI